MNDMLHIGEIVEAVGWVMIILTVLCTFIVGISVAGEYVGHRIRMRRKRREAKAMFEEQAQRRQAHKERLERAETYAQWVAHRKELPLD